MKKVLLSAVAFMAAMSLNAQEVEVCVFNADNALELDSENGTALTAGTEIGSTTSIVATIGADDTYKPQSATFTVNGTDITGGLQGATNPKDADSGVPATTLVQPASGAFFQFEAKADGYLYVMHKASSNKAYTVFEEGTAISYTYAAIGDASSLLGGVYAYTLPYEVENEQFVVKESVGWAEQEYLKVANPDAYAANWKEETADDGSTKKTWDPAIKINGLGVIKFPVYKDCKYIVNANGSKITAAGFVFSKEDNVLIQSGDVVIYKGEGAPEPVAFDVWTVAGVSTLCGSEWKTDDESNDMKTTDGVTYTLVKEGIVLEKGIGVEFKVAKDHAWTESYGDGSNNASFTVEETGIYTVTVNFNAETKEITVNTEKTGEAEIGEKVYSIVGTLTGGWENDVDMELVNGVYSATIDIEAAGTYEFKIRQDHKWDVNWGVDGKQGGDNLVAELPANSSITVTFDPATAVINTYVVGGAIVPPVVGDGVAVIFNPENVLELDADNGTALAAGTVIGECDEIVATVGADDTYKPQSVKATAAGYEIDGGLQGGTNPKDADGGVPATTLVQPAGGAFLQFEAKADGFLYVIHKASSNKAYTVFEEGTAISYTFAAIGDAATDLGAVYQFTLPYEVENEQLVVKESIEWAEQEFLKITAPDKYAARWTTGDDGVEAWNAIKINGLGVIKFPVYKDCKYIVNANGSKITAGGFYFDTTGDATITATVNDAEVTIISGTSTAINASKFLKAENNGAIYNLAGQNVNASYKGIVIKNGNKYIQ
jgi:hypothetical protein